jgi:hypothetical protein
MSRKFFIFFNTYFFKISFNLKFKFLVEAVTSFSPSLILYHEVFRMQVVNHKLVIIQIRALWGPGHRRRPGPGPGGRDTDSESESARWMVGLRRTGGKPEDSEGVRQPHWQFRGRRGPGSGGPGGQGGRPGQWSESGGSCLLSAGTHMQGLSMSRLQHLGYIRQNQTAAVHGSRGPAMHAATPLVPVVL